MSQSRTRLAERAKNEDLNDLATHSGELSAAVAAGNATARPVAVPVLGEVALEP